MEEYSLQKRKSQKEENIASNTQKWDTVYKKSQKEASNTQKWDAVYKKRKSRKEKLI